MSDISTITINNQTYNIKDSEARISLSTKIEEAPMDGYQYARKDGEWEISESGGNSIIFQDDTAVITGAIPEETAFEIYNTIANSFSPDINYAINDLVLYDNGLYKFIDAHEAGDWDSSSVTTTVITDEFVKKTGDTMSGNLILNKEDPRIHLKSNRLDSTTSSISTADYPSFAIIDKNNRYLAWLQGAQETNGVVSVNFGSRRVVSGTTYTNSITLSINNDGTRKVYLTNVDAWRSALGVMPAVPVGIELSPSTTTAGNGGYIDFHFNHSSEDYTSRIIESESGKLKLIGKVETTDDILISKNVESDVFLKNTTITMGTAPSSNTWIGAYCFKDNVNNTPGYIGAQYNTSRSTIVRTLCRAKNSSNENVENYFDLISNYDGTKGVNFSNPDVWRRSLFPSNLSSSGQYLIGITNDWASGGYIPNNQVCDLIGATKTSVFPNDSGNIKTKCRCARSGFSGSGNPIWYYKVATFPATGNSNYCSLIFKGRFGGWVPSNMGYIEGMAWNRDGAGFASLALTKASTPTYPFTDFLDFAIYKNTSNNEEYVYILARNYFIFDLDFYTYQSTANIIYDGSYVTSLPSNYTQTALLSTSTPRVVVTGSKIYVNGTALN